MKLDRTQVPKSESIKNIDILPIETLKLKNKLPIHKVYSNNSEIVKLSLVFSAGELFQTKSLVANITNQIVRLGTKSYTSKKIADTLDFYGAKLYLQCEKDTAVIKLMVLKKYLKKVLPIMYEIAFEATIPDEEFALILKRKKSAFLVNNEKVNYVARNHFPKLIFGNNHPYGLTTTEKSFDELEKTDLINFYDLQYRNGLMFIMVAGPVDKTVEKEIETYFGNFNYNENYTLKKESIYSFPNPQKMVIEKENALQSAIRIGKATINRTHPDYTGLNFVNTLLGGYFSSRLMKNIREEKGLTYGIGSVVFSFFQSGYLILVSEVNADKTELALTEIYNEINRLICEPVPLDELELVKNYSLGNAMMQINGAYKAVELYKELILSGLGFDYLQKIVTEIQEITSESVINLASKYLKIESLSELVVGKK